MIARKLLGAVALGLFATVASAAYPERDITGTIMWGAGGAMDVVSRAIQPHAEAVLGKKIVMVNNPGGTGAISTNFVNNAPNDGYNVLSGRKTRNCTRSSAWPNSTTTSSIRWPSWRAASE